MSTTGLPELENEPNVIVYEYDQPMARWFCETCGAVGHAYEAPLGTPVARGGAAVHRGRCLGEQKEPE